MSCRSVSSKYRSRFISSLSLSQELEVCHSEASARAEEMKTIKRENRKRRKIIEAYQDMLSQGATGLHPVRV